MKNSKYGNGFTKYIVTDEGELVTSIYEKESKHYKISRFLKMIDRDRFNKVTLVYYDDYGTKAHIRGIVNGEDCFTINLDREQYKRIVEGNYGNESLKALIDRTIDGKKYNSLVQMEEYFKYTGILPCNLDALKDLKNYIEECIDNTKANRVSRHIELNYPVYIYAISVLLRMGSDFTYSYNITASSVLYIAGKALLVPIVYHSVNLLCDKRYLTILEEIKESKELINRYNDELNIIENCDLQSIKRKELNMIKKYFYIEIKKAVKVINMLPEENRDNYLIRLRSVVRSFDKELKEADTKLDYRQECRKILHNKCDEIDRITDGIDSFNDNLDVDDRPKTFSSIS